MMLASPTMQRWTLVMAIACVLAAGCEDNTKDTATARPTAAPPAVVIEVVAKKWRWEFEYANGLISDELHVPAGVPVALDVSSLDVVHTLEVQGVTYDATPGKVTRATFTAKAGTSLLICAAACGMSDFSPMTASVHVEADFDRWLADAAKAHAGGSPIDRGKDVFERKGCNACHSLDGTPKVGAPLDGVWGQPIALADGTSPNFDEAFLRKALDDPQRFMRSGFPANMPSYQGQLSDVEVANLGAFLASLR